MAQSTESLTDEARTLAASCGNAEVSRLLHLLSERLEESERERAGLEALRLLSLETVADLDAGFAVCLREDPIGIARLLAGHFLDVLEDPRKWGTEGPKAAEPAPNYVEMTLRHETRGSVVVTVRRTRGKTPRDLQVEAERQRDEARALVLAWHEASKGSARALLSGGKDEVKASVDAYNAAHDALLRWAGVEGETDSLVAVIEEPGALDAQSEIVGLRVELDTAREAERARQERVQEALRRFDEEFPPPVAEEILRGALGRQEASTVLLLREAAGEGA